MTEKTILKDYKDHVARCHKLFKRDTHTQANLADFIYALNSEVQWMKRQYPNVKDKFIVERSYRNLLEAYQRSSEYSVKLTWKSLAGFVLNRRPGILWAVVQSRADGPQKTPKAIKVPQKERKIITERAWCSHCQTQALVINNRLECCGLDYP
jgi:hypothetical protein